MSYERVKKNWEDGLWDLVALKRAYAVGVITKEQYKYIKSLSQKGQGGLPAGCADKGHRKDEGSHHRKERSGGRHRTDRKGSGHRSCHVPGALQQPDQGLRLLLG